MQINGFKSWGSFDFWVVNKRNNTPIHFQMNCTTFNSIKGGIKSKVLQSIALKAHISDMENDIQKKHTCVPRFNWWYRMKFVEIIQVFIAIDNMFNFSKIYNIKLTKSWERGEISTKCKTFLRI